MKYTIIGGSGFVGSRLIEILGEENCHNIDIRPSPFYNEITTICDVCSLELEKAFPSKTDVVVLLAAEHRDDVWPISKYYDVNVSGTKNVLQVMRKIGINRLVFTSSVAVYGLNKDITDEGADLDPFNHYGKSKYEAEKLIMNYFHEDPGMRDVVILRPTVIFGERNRGNVFNLLKFISKGSFIMIGNGRNRKSMAYVGNVVAFIDHISSSFQGRCEVYNYVDKPDMTMLDLVDFVRLSFGKNGKVPLLPYWVGLVVASLLDFVAWIFGKKFPFSRVRLQKFCAKTQFNSEKLNETGFVAPFTLREGLLRTLHYEFIDNSKNLDNITFITE